jgi:alkanesulfonate monooxygenase SsuD/methylene tetrahydromethanopterin reductase-like flavin-dependent oxidoreductase (luciferase family)
MLERWIVGTPEDAAEQVAKLAATYDVDEVMLHPVAGAVAGTPADRAPAREATLRLLADALA